MKKLKLFLSIASMFTILTGCSSPYQEQFSTEQLDAKYESYNNIITLSDKKDSMNSEISDVTEGVRAIITINGKEYGMTITDTTIGRAFAKKLQNEGVYTVTGYRSADDICCSESESLETDSTENMPWICGGVAWTGSWFTVWVSENDADRDMPVVAQIDEEYSKELQALSGNMEIEVRLAAEVSDSKYTVEDLRNLQDFLLVRETPDLSGKDYDLNNDDRWDVFDLCLMRKELLNQQEESKLKIEINGHTLTATLENNTSAQELAELIKNEPLVLNLNEYGSFEKVGSLPQSLPKDDERITTEPGDIMLYQGNQITIFYGSNTWSYTKLGKIDNISQSELKEIMGDGDVTVTLSLSE